MYKKRKEFSVHRTHRGQEDYRQSKEKAYLLIFNRLLKYFFFLKSSLTFEQFSVKNFLFSSSLRACIRWIVIVPCELYLWKIFSQTANESETSVTWELPRKILRWKLKVCGEEYENKIFIMMKKFQEMLWSKKKAAGLGKEVRKEKRFHSWKKVQKSIFPIKKKPFSEYK